MDSSKYDSLQNLVANLGTARDKRESTTWVTRQFDRDTLSAMYRDDWLAGKIVDVPADDMTRKWRTFTSGSLDYDKLTRIQEAETELQVQAKFNEAIKWARLYGGAAIVLGIDGAGEMSDPLVLEQVKEGSLKYLLVLDRYDLTPGVVNTTDPSSPDFRKPQYYTIIGGRSNIHFSRVLLFDGVDIPWVERQRENYWGQSILQRVHDALLDSQTVSHITASMLYEAKLDVIRIRKLHQQLTAAGGEAAIVQRFQVGALVKSINNTLLLDMDEEAFEQKQISFAGLPELILQYLNIAAAAADIPATRMLGESAPGLNATGSEQTRQYYDMVSSQQEMRIRKQLAYFDQIMVRSVIGDMPDDWTFEFESLWQMSDLERADIELKRAQRDQIHLGAGNITSAIAVQQLKEDGTYPIEDDYIEALEEIEPLPGEDTTTPEQEEPLPVQGEQEAAQASEELIEETPEEEETQEEE